MVLEISSAALRAIVRDADADPAREACGLLLGRGDRITHVIPCRNVAATPEDTFEIDPEALFAAHRAARGGGAPIIGCYHSHPGGAASPSVRDAAAATPAMPFWIIVAGGVCAGWRFTATGPLAGHFAPVALHRIPDGCTKVAPSPQGGDLDTRHERPV